ncbi:hypothetical protein OG216_39105 [Streptomycetaceae bacterium NBC_01309]
MIWGDPYVNATASFLPPRTDIATVTDNGSRRFNSALGYRSATIAEPGTGPGMAAKAALLALKDSGFRGDALSLLTLAAALPGNTSVLSHACQVQRALALDHARAPDLNAASAGDVAGLVAGAEHLRANPDAIATLAAATSCLTEIDRLNSPDHVMSDGAAALVLSRRPGRVRLVATSHAAAPQLEVLTHVNLTPVQRLTALKRLKKPQLATMQEKTCEAVGLVLDEAATSIDKITRIVVPGAGIPFLSAVIAQPLGIELAKTTWPFARHVGHAGPCDHFLGLDHLLRHDSALKTGDRILVIGLGAGWRWICVLVELVDQGPS